MNELLIKAYSGDLNKEVTAYIESEYSKLFSKTLNKRCNDCYRDAAIEIMCELRNSNNYILGSEYAINYNGIIYVSHTLTDEVAEAFLNENPNELFKFVKYPIKKKEVESEVNEKEEVL